MDLSFLFGTKSKGRAQPPRVGARRPIRAGSTAPAVRAKIVSSRETSGYESSHAQQVRAPSLVRYMRNNEPFVVHTEQEFIESKIFFNLIGEGGAESVPKEKRIEVATWLSNKVFPVLVSGRQNTIWLLATPEYAGSDDIEEISKGIVQKGYQMHPDFQVIVCSETLLLAISRGNLGGKRMQLRRKVEKDRNSAELFSGFTEIISWAHTEGAADVDFRWGRREERSCVGFSIGGKWVYPDRFKMPSMLLIQMLGLAFQFGEGASEPSLDPGIEQQLRIFLDLPKNNVSVMLRWASMAGDETFSVTCRIIELNRRVEAISLETLGYLPSQRATLNRVLNSDGGAVILSGVVNSGKSTTIATLMGMVPKTRKIVTIEDPVEFMIPGAIANTVARPLTGESSPILAAKLRTLKRTGFNDLLLGEIRDRETGAAAQDVFESGQKLYSTVHTGRAWMIPDRLAGQSIGIPREVLATPGNLRLLVNQSLIPRSCPHCKRPFTSLMQSSDSQMNQHWIKYAERLKRLYDISMDEVCVRNPDGCDKCRRIDMPDLNGFSGRTSASEMIEPDEPFCRLVSRGDNVGILYYLDELRAGRAYSDPNMTGKSSMDCAIYKMAVGELDPREIEPRYADFETVELNRSRFNQGRSQGSPIGSRRSA